MPTKRPYRLSLIAAMLAAAGQASALGLGDIRSVTSLGEAFHAEVDILTAGKEPLDPACFRLQVPDDGDELPWLRSASLSVRKGPAPVLEIRAAAPVRDPILQVALRVVCGHEMQRRYTLFFSPRGGAASPPVSAADRPAVPEVVPPPARQRRERSAASAGEAVPPPAPLRRTARSTQPPRQMDRLVLFDEAGDPSLRLATELAGWKEGGAGLEARRNVLRLEYRMLAAMQEQALSQLAAAEKLRAMESTLDELQQRAGEFAGRLEEGARAPAQSPAPVASPQAAPTPVQPPQPAKPPVQAQPPAPPADTGDGLSEWSFYGALVGAALGLAGWLAWRHRRQREEASPIHFSTLPPEPVADPLRDGEEEAAAGATVDLHLGSASRLPMEVDVPLDADDAATGGATPAAAQAVPVAAQPSILDASVDEHFEANPVMELAEIMLSFGRVRGAAQALQEYIDHNPEEALQPWIKLMDVYRMAGMRDEFEKLARDLNQHFNVEIQQWEPKITVSHLDSPLDFVLEPDTPGQSSAGPKAMALEDMEHLRNQIVQTWGLPECTAYLHRLLRDNRGGKRNGFTLPVVEEIMFLIELLDTRNLIEKEANQGEKHE